MRLVRSLLLITAMTLAACSAEPGSSSSEKDAQSTDGSGDDGSAEGDDDGSAAGDDDGSAAGDDELGTGGEGQGDDGGAVGDDAAGGSGTGVVPAPTAQPTLPDTYAGECPQFTTGANQFQSAGHSRTVQIFFPSNPVEKPAVLYIWHALGANATLFANLFQAQIVADEWGAIVVVPESCCSVQAEWVPSADLPLFDDLLSCLDETYGVDRTRVYTTGFSAGGLWSTVLTMNRANMLAASVIFSGGVTSWLPYVKPATKIPTVLVDGGPGDIFGGVVNFHTMTATLADNLIADGHQVIHCIHSNGHQIPLGAATWARPFLFDHQFGVPSPYTELDDTWPSYCTLRLPSE